MSVPRRNSSQRAFIGSALLAAGGFGASFAAIRESNPLWDFFETTLRRAKYIDLTHAMAPGGPIGEGFADFKVGAARAGVSIPGLIRKGQPFTYAGEGVAITAYDLPMDHIGTQLGPPAHMNDHGATISDIPPTVALRPLVVVNVAAKVAADPGYQATVADVKAWERRYGPIPAGSVVMIRSDWSKRWSDPQRFTARPFPGVALPALQYLHLKRRILMHGHEPLDADDTAPRFVGETWLLEHNFAQAEGVANLDQAPECGALISIGFAKFQGGTGGFARYVAIAPADWPHGLTIEEQPGAPLPTHARPLRRSVGNFGTLEFWFALIKVVAIVLFILLGAVSILGIGRHAVGFHNLTGLPGGFLPKGWTGLWMAVTVGIFSFNGIEVIAVTSGETENPRVAIPAALRTMVLRLFLFYVLAIAVIVTTIPWTDTGVTVVAQSPFVTVFQHSGIRDAAGVMNFVVISAALSSMNTNVYLCSRMLFSLSRGGYAPRLLGELSGKGSPVAAILASGAGILLAAAASAFTPNAYGDLLGVALFAAILVWMFILVCHLGFRRHHRPEDLPVRMPLFPWMQYLGLGLLAAILVTMGLDPTLDVSWVYGVPWVIVISAVYFVWRARSRAGWAHEAAMRRGER